MYTYGPKGLAQETLPQSSLEEHGQDQGTASKQTASNPPPAGNVSKVEESKENIELGGLDIIYRKGIFTDLKVTVGKDSKARQFNLHKNIMAAYSGYFLKALSDNGTKFIEAVESHVRLPDEDPDVFERLVAFFYGTWLIDENIYGTVKLYQMSDYFDAPELKKAAMADITQKIKSLKLHKDQISQARNVTELNKVKDAPPDRHDRFTADYVYNIQECNNIQEFPSWRSPMSLFRNRPVVGKNLVMVCPTDITEQASSPPHRKRRTRGGGGWNAYDEDDGSYYTDDVDYATDAAAKRSLAGEKKQLEADVLDEIADVLVALCRHFHTKDAGLFRTIFQAIVGEFSSKKDWKNIIEREEVMQTLVGNPALAAEALQFVTGALSG